MNVRIKHVDELYHARERPAPDVALLCHPGFDNYKELWHPTMDVLFRFNIPVLVAGHSNFTAPTHDALMHQDLGLIAFGAKSIKPQMWNPFCQAYVDPTKGSLLAPPGREHDHCNLALVSIFRGGDLKPFAAVDSFFDALDYLAVSVVGFPPHAAVGPMLRDTPLRLKYGLMSQSERDAAVKLLHDLTQGTLRAPATASELVQLLERRGLGRHYGRGRGNW